MTKNKKMSETLKVIVENEIIIISFENQKLANCFGVSEASQLERILNKNKKANGLIFHSLHSKTFCAGGNLNDYSKLKSKAQGLKINKKISKVLNTLNLAAFPTVCIVTGDCLGGGTELISAFDKVIATPSAYFGFWQRKQGLSFGWGGFSRLTRRMATHTLKDLALDARRVSAYEALGLSLVDSISLKSQALNVAKNWLNELSKLPKAPFTKIKFMNEKSEVKSFSQLWMGPEHKEILKRYKK